MVRYRTLSPYTFSMICVDNRIIEAFCGCSAQSLSEYIFFLAPFLLAKEKKKKRKLTEGQHSHWLMRALVYFYSFVVSPKCRSILLLKILV